MSGTGFSCTLWLDMKRVSDSAIMSDDIPFIAEDEVKVGTSAYRACETLSLCR